MTKTRTVTAAPAGRSRPEPSRLRPGPVNLAVLAACAAFLAVFSPATAPLAEEPPADPDLSIEGMGKVGPFHIAPTIVLKDFGYDDNVFYGTEEDRQGDYTATIAPGLRALLLGRHRGGLVIDQSYDFVSFMTNSQLDHWNAHARARGILLAGPSVLSLEAGFNSVRERPSSEIDTRVRLESNTLVGEARTRLSGRLNGVASVGHTTLRYVSGDNVERISESLDRDESTLTLTGELKLRPRTVFFVEGAVTETDFTSPREVRDTTAFSVMPGVRMDTSSPIQGEIKAGIISLDAPDRDEISPNPGHDRDYRGLVGAGAISVRLGSRSRAKLTGGRSLPFTTLSSNLYAVQTEWSASVEQFLTRRLSAELKHADALLDYPEKVSGEYREDAVQTWEILVHYKLADQFAVTVSGQHQVRDSSDDTLDRDRNLIAFGTSIGL
jgi:hypothetical protein